MRSRSNRRTGGGEVCPRVGVWLRLFLYCALSAGAYDTKPYGDAQNLTGTLLAVFNPAVQNAPIGVGGELKRWSSFETRKCCDVVMTSQWIFLSLGGQLRFAFS